MAAREEYIQELYEACGSQVEYKVIEMVLQSCNWDRNMAQIQLDSMLGHGTKPIAPASFSEGWTEVKRAKRCVNEYSAGSHSKKIDSATSKSNSPQSNKLLILMRGLPGSGKSTLAQTLVQENGVVYSTDDFFYDYYGSYFFDRNYLQDAHEWNRRRTKESMRNGVSPIVVDNTNIEAWHMQPYAVLALRFSYNIQITEPDTPWKFNPHELSQKNSHNASRQTIEYMLMKYRSNITVNDILPTELRKDQSGTHEYPKIGDKLCHPSSNNEINHNKKV